MQPQQPERRSVDQGFLTRLAAEVQEWQSRGVISPEQSGTILGGYQALPPGQKARNRLVSVLAVLGALLVGLGVILFFASNWQEISKATKLALMLVVVPATYAVGYWLRYHNQRTIVGAAIIFLGTLAYGAAIHLVAQVYHLPVNAPNLMALWFLGVLPLAYLTRSQVILVEAILLFLVAAGFRIPVWVDQMNAIPFFVFPVYLSLGLMLYGIGKWQAQWSVTRGYAPAYEIIGLVTALGAVYLLTFRLWWEKSSFSVKAAPESTEFWLVLAISTGLAIGLHLEAVIQGGQRLWRQVMSYQTLAALLLLAAAYLVVYVPVGGDLVYPLLFNFLLFISIVGLVFVGYFRGEERIINLALAVFGIDVVTRYLEYSWNLLDRSLVFIVAGLVLLGGGYLLERGRRQVIGRLRQSGGGA